MVRKDSLRHLASQTIAQQRAVDVVAPPLYDCIHMIILHSILCLHRSVWVITANLRATKNCKLSMNYRILMLLITTISYRSSLMR